MWNALCLREGVGGEDNEDAKTNKAEGGALCTNRKNGRSWNWW